MIVASVTYSHYDYIKAALSAGKAVYTEKPISHNSMEIAEVVDMAERLGLVFIVGYQRRIDKNFLELHRQCSIGALGPLRMIKCCSRDNPLPPLEYLRVSGGIFYDMLKHDIDMMHWLSWADSRRGPLRRPLLQPRHCRDARPRHSGSDFQVLADRHR